MKKEMKKSTVKFLAATLSAFTIAGTAVAFSTPTKVYATETGADYEVYANRGRHFTGFVGKYNGVIGQEYYIVERVNELPQPTSSDGVSMLAPGCQSP